MAFGSILGCCFWFDSCLYINISSPLELPFLGCFLLLGSSIVVTGFHHLLQWYYSGVLLLSTVFLGVLFICMQLIEMKEIFMGLADTTFHASSLCTIGLHFSHVLVGVIGLITVYIIGPQVAGYFRCSVVTWYWHFVDYI